MTKTTMRIALLVSLMLAAGCRMLDDIKETALHLAATTVLQSVFSLQSAPLTQSSFKSPNGVPSTPQGVPVANTATASNQRAQTVNPIVTVCRRARHATADRITLRTLTTELRIARCKLKIAQQHPEVIVLDRL
jgi:hypothetical protein